MERAKEKIDQNRVALEKENWSEKELDLIVRSLHNRIDFIRMYFQFKQDSNYVDRFTARDSVMAENVLWLAEQIYPGQKIIISAHNHHISRFNERDFVMGEKLAGVYGDELYAIGLFPSGGSFANNSRQEEPMETTGTLEDLQYLILQTTADYQFLPIPKKSKPGAAWFFQPITINNTLINIWGDDQMTLAESFDGLIFLREISPAVYR